MPQKCLLKSIPKKSKPFDSLRKYQWLDWIHSTGENESDSIATLSISHFLEYFKQCVCAFKSVDQAAKLSAQTSKELVTLSKSIC